MEKLSRTGWIEVVSGVMFSGKSEELMRRVRRATLARRRVQVFKSQLDDRYGIREVVSHDNGRLGAEMVSSSGELMRRVRGDTQVVAVDEVQFMDDGVVGVLNALPDRGVRGQRLGRVLGGGVAAARGRRALASSEASSGLGSTYCMTQLLSQRPMSARSLKEPTLSRTMRSCGRLDSSGGLLSRCAAGRSLRAGAEDVWYVCSPYYHGLAQFMSTIPAPVGFPQLRFAEAIARKTSQSKRSSAQWAAR